MRPSMEEKDAAAVTTMPSPASPASTKAADESLHPIDPVIEKRILRKLDFKMMPVLWFLFLVSFVDRGNIGESRDHTWAPSSWPLWANTAQATRRSKA